MVSLTNEALILSIVSKHSGGIKFTDLLTEWITNHSIILPEVLEEWIRSMPDLAILEYSWDMGRGCLRHKMFVYEVND